MRDIDATLFDAHQGMKEDGRLCLGTFTFVLSKDLV